MRTINKSLKKRLIAQASEAQFQGLEKVASSLTKQASANPVREDAEDYMYSGKDLKEDVESLLWSVATRTQDYYGKTADAPGIGELIERTAEELIASIRNKIGGDVIGPHEPSVPGQAEDNVEIEDYVESI